LKVLHVTQQLGLGGACIACERLHASLLEAGVESSVICETDAQRVGGVACYGSTWPLIARSMRAGLELLAARLHLPCDRWPYALPDGLLARLNEGPHDVVHLQWFTQRFLPLADVTRISKPCVWSLQDLWPITFPDRYPEALSDGIEFWRPEMHPQYGAVRQRLLKRVASWARHHRVQLVCLSRWQRDFIERTALFDGVPAHIVPNPIDTRRFAPFDKAACRAMLGIAASSFVMVSAANPMAYPAMDRKGGDLLRGALERCAESGLCRDRPAELWVIGHTGATRAPVRIGSITVRFAGLLSGPEALALHFAAADLCIVTSRMETFGIVASEAQACGCPAVGFDITGTSDVVLGDRTGILVPPFDDSALAEAITEMERNVERRARMAQAGREHVEATMSYPVVARAMTEIFEQQAAAR
jgi:glycosyltransferase involved in cell wall biosynthesis